MFLVLLPSLVLSREPPSAPAVITNVTILCKFREHDWGSTTLGQQYSCFNPMMWTGSNRRKESLTTAVAIDGPHPDGNTNSDVRAFYLLDDTLFLHRITQGIEKFFPKILVFGWIEGQLRTISSNDLAPFPELRYFHVGRNKLSSLDGDLFKHNPKLEFVHFGENRLRSVGYGLLDGLKSLTRAFFFKNYCIDENAYTAEQVTKLRVDLRKQCSVDEVGIFIYCGFVDYVLQPVGPVYTCNNPIFTDLGDKARVLDVNGVHIVGKGYESVKAFHVHEFPFELERIPEGIGYFFPYLILFMWIRGHLIAITAEDLMPFPDLEKLDVSHNKFTSLHGDLFKHTPKIDQINFAGNQLHYVDAGLFNVLEHLNFADFSANPCIDFRAEDRAAIKELEKLFREQCSADYVGEATLISDTSRTSA